MRKLSKRETRIIIFGLQVIGVSIIIAGFFWIFGS